MHLNISCLTYAALDARDGKESSQLATQLTENEDLLISNLLCAY